MPDDGQAGGGEHGLHGGLVHADGAAEDAGADVGDVCEFEEALDGAVFAEGAVKDGKNGVEGGGVKVWRGLGFGLLVWDERSGDGIDRGGMCFAGGEFRGRVAVEQGLGVRAAEPLAGLGDADGNDFVFFAIDGLEDGGGGEERDFVLA